MTTSLIGNGILMVALAWQVYDLSGLPAAMSAVGVALSLPQVVTLLIGGVVSDRLSALSTTRGLHLCAGVSALAIPILIASLFAGLMVASLIARTTARALRRNDRPKA